MQLLAAYLIGTIVTVPVVLFIIYKLSKDSQHRNSENKVNNNLPGEGIVLAGVVAVVAGICWLPLLILALCVYVEKLME